MTLAVSYNIRRFVGTTVVIRRRLPVAAGVNGQ